MEKIAYGVLGVFAIAWIIAITAGLVIVFPYGIIGLVIILGFGLLLIKALKDRLANKEDDYYSKNVDH